MRRLAMTTTENGLLELLHKGNDRFLLTVNTGDIPAELSALAPLIGLGLLADAEGLIDGSWKKKLTGSPLTSK